MPDLWFALASVLLTAYVVMAGFDLGAGALHVFHGDRRAVIAAVGPFWHGNEVWILAAGGTLMLAFPAALGAALSGFYLGIFFALWSLMLRAAAIELRDHVESDLWHAFWDAVLSLTSATYVFLLGVVLGNLVRGVPIGADGTFATALFGGRGGLVDPYTFAVGAFALLATASHGATFLAWKTGDARFLGRLWPITLVAWAAIFAATRFLADFGPHAESWALVPVAIGAAVAATVLSRRGRYRSAFLASCAFLASNMIGIAAAMHPTILRSLDGRDLRAADVVSSDSGLRTAVYWWLLAFILAAIYAANTFRHSAGKSKTDA